MRGVLSCDEVLTWSPINMFSTTIGLFRVIIGFSYIFTISIVLFWSSLQERNARSGNIEPVLFPHFTKLLWFVGLVDLFTLFIILFVDLTPGETVEIAKLLYCAALGLQHSLTEGIAYLLMQKGCGLYAMKKTKNVAFCWFLICFLSYYCALSTGLGLHLFGWSIWLLGLLFYAILWLSPSKSLFRRPSAISYARFWFCYRSVLLLCFALSSIHPRLVGRLGSCLVVVIGFLGYALFHPLVIYWSFLEDSRYIFSL
jgi:hypothetical protein